MTDTEINEAVARELGWRDDFDLTNKTKCWTNYEQKWKTVYDLPDYCHSIAAAWEIVEKHPFSDDGKIKDGLAFGLMRREDGWNAGWCRYDDCMMVDAFADTAPMAICLAFLKLEG